MISNSWGANEFTSETSYDAYFHHNIPITASTGDAGYGVSWPASSPYVTGVGGTSLVHAGNTRGWSETAWSGAGSGCSAYEPKPAFQTDTGCARRTVADVSAVADPNTGVAVYDSYNEGGWLVFGGTSVVGADRRLRVRACRQRREHRHTELLLRTRGVVVRRRRRQQRHVRRQLLCTALAG